MLQKIAMLDYLSVKLLLLDVGLRLLSAVIKTTEQEKSRPVLLKLSPRL